MPAKKSSKGLGFLEDISNGVNSTSSLPADGVNKVGASDAGISGFVEGMNDSVDTVDKTIGKSAALYNQAKGFKSKTGNTKKKVIDIGSRFQNAFGFVGGNVGKNLQNTGIKNSLGGTVFVMDGRSSYENFTLKHNDVIIKFSYTGFLQQQDGVLAPPPLVRFRQEKRIDETVVTSNDRITGKELSFGQVVEAYGRKPTDITIRGILVDMVNHQYPGDKIEQLVSLFNYQGVWEVSGDVFDKHGIGSIYFTGLDDEPIQGYQDSWSFTITAKSITPVEIVLNKSTPV